MAPSGDLLPRQYYGGEDGDYGWWGYSEVGTTTQEGVNHAN